MSRIVDINQKKQVCCMYLKLFLKDGSDFFIETAK